MDTHHIHRQIIELHVPEEAGTQTLRQQMATAIETHFSGTFERLVDRMVPRGQTLRLEQLHVDLGHFAGATGPEQVPHRLEQVLEAALQRAIGEAQAVEVPPEEEKATAAEASAWETFLTQGQLPWDTPEDWSAWLLHHTAQPSTQTRALIEPTVLHRLLHHLTDAQLWTHWAEVLPQALPIPRLQSLYAALPTTAPARAAFWEQVLSQGQTPGPAETRLLRLVQHLRNKIPGAWTGQGLPPAWATALKVPANTPWQALANTPEGGEPRGDTLSPPISDSGHGKPSDDSQAQGKGPNAEGTHPASPAPAQAHRKRWLSDWAEALRQPLTEVAHLKDLLALLEQARPLFEGTPAAYTVSDLRVLLQGRLRQRQRQAAGIHAQAQAQLHSLLEALMPPTPSLSGTPQEQPWQAWWEALRPHVPGIAHATGTDAQAEDALIVWARQQWLGRPAPPPITETAYQPWIAAWQALAPPSGTALPPTVATQWWEHHQAQLSPLPQRLREALHSWLFPAPLLSAEAARTLVQALPEAPPALQESRVQLKTWLQLHQAVPDEEFVQTLRPELGWLEKEVQQQRSGKSGKAPGARRPAALLDEYYVPTGGLVILWPFLRPFFRHVAYLSEEDTFATEALHARAPMLLWYLASGQTEATEPQLALCKVLAGWPLAEPLPVTLDPTDTEREQIHGLLSSALQPSARLAQSGPDSFRGNFLLREAVLRPPAPSWTLHVERKPFDVLLDSLPWQWNMVKLPWLDPMLHVTWGEPKPNF